MRFSILGPLAVFDDDARPVTIGGARLRTLLVLLLTDPGRSVSTERLIDGIWDGGAPASAANALQALVSRLRRTLGGGVPIVGDATGYRAEAARHRIDLWEFEDLVARARSLHGAGDPEAAVRDYGTALSLWRGEALTDLAGKGLAEGLAARVTELRRSAAVERLGLYLDLGRHNEALPDIESLVAREPLRERPVELLMRALAGVGRQADALAAYAALRRRLADELGVDPSAHIRELHVRLLRGELEPAAPQPPRSPRRSVAARPPSGLSSFIGREDEVRAATEALGRQRLITLTGPGGTGKTRLSVEIGTRFAEQHAALAEGGVGFVELAPLSSGAEIPPALLNVLGLRERVVMSMHAAASAVLVDPLERFADGVGDHPMLLILDNCEHLVAETAQVAERLLAACPGLRILATSREPLAVPGERLLPLPPLALPPEGATAEDALDYSSVRLFAERVAAVSPGFAVGPGNVDPVVRICRELDGLPLALELAAARVRAVPLPQLAERLCDRFRLLTSGSRSALPRHRTLEAVVDWSWELLDEAERTLLRRLSAFSGGATLESVEQVCADGADGRVRGRDVWSTLFALVDKSLVTAGAAGEDETATRYRMLETVRAYGARRLAESGEETAVRAAHARSVLRLWSESGHHLRGPDQLGWVPRLRAEYDNLTAALRFSVEQGDPALCLDLTRSAQWYWQMVDGWNEAGRWADEALRLAGDRPPEGRLVAYVECLCCRAAGDFTGATTQPGLQRALTLLTEAGEEPEDHHSLVYLGIYLSILRGEALAEFERLERRPEPADPWLRATLRFFQGMLALYCGRGSRADELFTRALAEFRTLGDRWGQSQVLSVSAEIAELTDPEGGAGLLAEGADLADEMGIRELSTMFRMRLAFAHAARGETVRAREYLAELHDRTLDPHQDYLVGLAAAETARVEGDLAGADRVLDELHTEVQAMAPLFCAQLEPLCAAGSARVRMDAGDWPGARAKLTRAWTLAVRLKDAGQQAALLEGMARLALGEGEPARAARLLGGGEAVRGLANRAATEVRRTRADLCERLGEAGFAELYDRGARTAPATLIAETGHWLGVPPEDGPPPGGWGGLGSG